MLLLMRALESLVLLPMRGLKSLVLMRGLEALVVLVAGLRCGCLSYS